MSRCHLDIDYSGKKKRHTLKAQILITETGTIIAVAVGVGRRHDMRVYRGSDTHLHPELPLRADSGFQGVQKLHTCTTPHQRYKETPTYHGRQTTQSCALVSAYFCGTCYSETEGISYIKRGVPKQKVTVWTEAELDCRDCEYGVGEGGLGKRSNKLRE